MAAWLSAAGWSSVKPIVAALLLPPVPLLALILFGAWALQRRRRSGAWLIGGALALLWLSATTGAAEALEAALLRPPSALGAEDMRALQSEAAAAIVVLGGGMEPLAPEYGAASLRPASLERLRYGVWLARATGLPLAFSGGIGYVQQGVPAEARIAARIAADEFGLSLRWIEERSRDTRENAAASTALLRASGIRHIVLVTHAWHMPRALRAFRDAAGADLRIDAAPMGLARELQRAPLRWMPSATGFREMHHVLHELIGALAGA